MLLEVVLLFMLLMATSWLSGFWSHPIGARIAYYPSLIYGIVKTSKQRQWYNRIDERVVLGALPFHKTAEEVVKSEGVRAVISLNEAYEMRFLCPTEKQWNEMNVKQLCIPTVDFNNAPSLEHIRKSMEFIEQAENSIYIHCKAGRSRSATVVVCYLMYFKRMSMDEAVELVKSKRPHIVLADKHIQRIKDFDKLSS